MKKERQKIDKNQAEMSNEPIASRKLNTIRHVDSTSSNRIDSLILNVERLLVPDKLV